MDEIRTAGVGSFGERLFRVESGHSADFALEQAAILMSCVNKLTHHAMLEHDESMVCAAHYLSGMAKALIEDIAHTMMGNLNPTTRPS